MPLRFAVASCAAVAFVALAWPMIELRIGADHFAGRTPQEVILDSGDSVFLDAEAAIVERTSSADREAELLNGVAFFHVKRDERAFMVRAGGRLVRVLGTFCEVSRSGDVLSVAVVEGSVEVVDGELSWHLTAGDLLRLHTDKSPQTSQIRPGDVAAWRWGRLIATGTPLSEIADAIDRRLAGRIVIIGGQLGEARIVGNFDLSRPLSALRAAAAAEGARVLAAPPALTLVVPAF
ncbi:MAG: FecR domain-containing protein [Pseudomonadota bacterium]